MNVCTVILGAGKGSRMKSITPKPFHKVANLELIDWVLNTLNSIKIDNSDLDIYQTYIHTLNHINQHLKL